MVNVYNQPYERPKAARKDTHHHKEGNHSLPSISFNQVEKVNTIRD